MIRRLPAKRAAGRSIRTISAVTAERKRGLVKGVRPSPLPREGPCFLVDIQVGVWKDHGREWKDASERSGRYAKRKNKTLKIQRAASA